MLNCVTTFLITSSRALCKLLADLETSSEVLCKLPALEVVFYTGPLI